MSDTAKRDAVLDRYSGGGWDVPDHEAMADRIVELEDAVERVRVLHTPEIVGDTCPSGCQGTDALIEARVGEWEWPPCPTLRALEVGRE